MADINIRGKLVNATVDGVIADASQIKDGDKFQSEINASIKDVSSELREDVDNLKTSKADIEDLSNVYAEDYAGEVFDTPDSVTREELKKDLFIDMWNSACGSYGRYNPDTGYFELHGLTDITYDEALKIAERPLGNQASLNGFYGSIIYTGIRTNLCLRTTPHVQANCMNMCNWTNFEVFRLNDGFIPNPSNLGTSGMFVNCSRLKRILGWINCSLKVSDMNLPDNLEEISLRNVCVNFNMGKCRKISYESIAYLINYASNIATITITVHPDVYAKLIDTTNTEWNALLTLAASKNISFATV